MWNPQKLIRFPDPFAMDSDYVTAPAPKVLWIELTSKCPFDCIFCTRKVRFGAGRHLDFEIYKQLIADLDAPDFIGLNYSGESIYYPRLLEAIRLARSSGAFTELVTAFSTISEPLLRGIVESGLDRLAISLHTMDPEQYLKIYRFGSLDLLKKRVDDFFRLKAALGVQKPRLDLCFVAMDENLDQLPRVADYARQVGVPEMFVHPIIGRHLIPQDFSTELAANKLRDGFKTKLRSTIAAVHETHPDLPVTVLNSDIEVNPRILKTPQYYAPTLPVGARIHSCDQSPFESVHILAGGNVVVCEVHDEVSLGNLHEQPLREIWLGERYREFRRKYVSVPPPECQTCVWKIAYEPDQWTSKIIVKDGLTPQLVRGWFAHEGTNTIWSKRQALLALRRQGPNGRVRLKGVLPAGQTSEGNTLAITSNRTPIGEIVNRSDALMPFDSTFAFSTPSGQIYLDFAVSQLFRPALLGLSNDARDLGFGLQSAEVVR